MRCHQVDSHRRAVLLAVKAIQLGGG